MSQHQSVGKKPPGVLPELPGEEELEPLVNVLTEKPSPAHGGRLFSEVELHSQSLCSLPPAAMYMWVLGVLTSSRPVHHSRALQDTALAMTVALEESHDFLFSFILSLILFWGFHHPPFHFLCFCFPLTSVLKRNMAITSQEDSSSWSLGRKYVFVEDVTEGEEL